MQVRAWRARKVRRLLISEYLEDLVGSHGSHLMSLSDDSRIADVVTVDLGILRRFGWFSWFSFNVLVR